MSNLRVQESSGTSGILHNKTALVTGGGAGLGAATAHLLAASGARVAIADIDQKAADLTASKIEDAGGTACVFSVDVADPNKVHSMIHDVVSTYGTLDIAINNAAITPDTKPLVELDVDQWDRLLNINLKGVALCLKYELQQMMRQGHGGSIINVSSVRGFRGKANAAAYVAAKHGVVGLTKVAALEHGANNIRVNCIAPGPTDTPMLRQSQAKRNPHVSELPSPPNLLNRLGSPEEVAQAALWLASDLASYITGTTVHADGGYLAT